MKKMRILSITAIVLFSSFSLSFAQCQIKNFEQSAEFTFAGHRYLIIKDKMSIAQAQECATSLDAQLAQLNSSLEANAVIQQLIDFTEEKLKLKQITEPVQTAFVIGNNNNHLNHHFQAATLSDNQKNGAEEINDNQVITITNWMNQSPASWVYSDVMESNFGANFFVFEFDQLKHSVEEQAQFKVFPSVTEDILNIQSTVSIQQINILAIDGQLVKTIKINSNIDDGYDFNINIQELRNGIYLLDIQYGDAYSITKRIIKQ